MGKGTYSVYTDGSYNFKTNNYAYAYIFVKDDNIKYSYVYKRFDNTRLRNIAAELKAVMLAVKMARQLRIKANIYYDCASVHLLLKDGKKISNPARWVY